MKLPILSVLTALLFFGAGQTKAQAQSAIDQISAIAVPSTCASFNWRDRGRAPKAYIRGMAVVFAKSLCQSNRADVAVVSATRGTPGSDLDRTDALAWY